MNFAHYDVAIPYDALAENLVNSHDITLQEPEHLRGIDDLRGFMAHHGIAADEAVTTHDLQKTRALRSATRQVFESRSESQATRRINSLLAGKRYAAVMSTHGAGAVLGWRIATEDGAAAQLEAAVAINLAALLQAVGFARYRVCHASPCQDVFIDLSKKGNRIFCGPRCATRVHVAQFRKRERAGRGSRVARPTRS